MLLFCASCAKYSAQFEDKTQQQLPNAPLIQTVYLIGDGGNAPANQSTPLFDHLTEVFSIADSKSTSIWLGDNIYPVGLAPVGHEDRALGEHRLKVEMNSLKNFKGKSYFIPGNHDWYEYGDQGVLRQEEFVESYMTNQELHASRGQDEYFVPSHTCGDIKEVIVNDQLVILLMDSQWFLNQVDKYPSDHCLLHSRKDFENQLLAFAEKHKEKSIIFAAHHPVYTYGQHGGNISFSNHFFPLRQLNKKLWIPLPFVGTASGKGRTVVTHQDVNHVMNKYYQDIIKRAMAKSAKSILVSGHEHCLQFIERDDQYFLVSGSASKKEAVKKGEGTLFSMGEHGYAKLLYYENGQTWVQFVALDKKADSYTVKFTHQLKF